MKLISLNSAPFTDAGSSGESLLIKPEEFRSWLFTEWTAENQAHSESKNDAEEFSDEENQQQRPSKEVSNGSLSVYPILFPLFRQFENENQVKLADIFTLPEKTDFGATVEPPEIRNELGGAFELVEDQTAVRENNESVSTFERLLAHSQSLSDGTEEVPETSLFQIGSENNAPKRTSDPLKRIPDLVQSKLLTDDAKESGHQEAAKQNLLKQEPIRQALIKPGPETNQQKHFSSLEKEKQRQFRMIAEHAEESNNGSFPQTGRAAINRMSFEALPEAELEHDSRHLVKSGHSAFYPSLFSNEEQNNWLTARMYSLQDFGNKNTLFADVPDPPSPEIQEAYPVNSLKTAESVLVADESFQNSVSEAVTSEPKDLPDEHQELFRWDVEYGRIVGSLGSSIPSEKNVPTNQEAILQTVRSLVADQAMALNEGDQVTAEIQIYPKKLGQMNISLKQQDESLLASITVENAAAKEWLTGSIQQLTHHLLQQEIVLADVQVNLNQGADSGFSFDGQNNQSKSHQNFRNDQLISKEKAPLLNDQKKDRASIGRTGSISILV